MATFSKSAKKYPISSFFARNRAVFVGAPAGARTPDTRLKRAVLYLLSYWGRYETGTAGLEPTMTESKSGVLPLTLHPIINRHNLSEKIRGWDMGLEPTTPGTTIRCSTN